MEHNVVYIGNDRCRLYVGSSRRCVVTEPLVPYDAEIEYLRGTGTQYIDSGIECTGDLSIKCKFKVSTNVNSAMAGGILSGSTYFRHHLTPVTDNKNFYWLQYSNDGTSSIRFSYSTNTWYEVEIDATNGTYKINNTTGTFTPVSSSITTNANYGIFARLSGNLATQIRNGNVDFEYYQLLRNGVLLRDFIPVRKGTTGYMYDRVSGQLFGNAGTGSFTLGNDKT